MFPDSLPDGNTSGTPLHTTTDWNVHLAWRWGRCAECGLIVHYGALCWWCPLQLSKGQVRFQPGRTAGLTLPSGLQPNIQTCRLQATRSSLDGQRRASITFQPMTGHFSSAILSTLLCICRALLSFYVLEVRGLRSRRTSW